MTRGLAILCLLVVAASGCSGARARPSDETTETWTTGDDEALGLETPAASDEIEPASDTSPK